MKKNSKEYRLLVLLLRLEVQFAGYAMRLAPNDGGNETILRTIQEAKDLLQS